MVEFNSKCLCGMNGTNAWRVTYCEGAMIYCYIPRRQIHGKDSGMREGRPVVAVSMSSGVKQQRKCFRSGRARQGTQYSPSGAGTDRARQGEHPRRLSRGQRAEARAEIVRGLVEMRKSNHRCRPPNGSLDSAFPDPDERLVQPVTSVSDLSPKIFSTGVFNSLA